MAETRFPGIYIKRMFIMPDRKGELDAQKIDYIGTVQTRQWIVKVCIIATDYRFDGSHFIRDGLFPLQGAKYDIFPGKTSPDNQATLKSIRFEDTRNRLIHYAYLTYSTEFDIDENILNPLDVPPEINKYSQNYEVPRFRDALGALYQTSAGNPYNPPPSHNIKRRYVVFTYNVAELSNLERKKYEGKLNSKVFNAVNTLDENKIPPLRARVNRYEATQEFRLGIRYDRVNLEIEIRDTEEDSFLQRILDADYRDIDGTSFRDPVNTLEYLQTPTLLNGRGKSIKTAQDTLAVGLDADPNTAILQVNFGNSVFPPAPKPENELGIRPPPDGEFEILVDNEIIVIDGYQDEKNWKIKKRGQAGTLIEAHNSGAAIKLLPYYRFYYPDLGFADFNDIKLGNGQPLPKF